jgi:Mrp family chromosome partitioning ATPase
MSEQENCNHDCSSCGAACGERQAPPKAPLNDQSSVNHVIAVVSGKGGVGKSLVTALMAVAARREGFATAVLDADITGPSIPKAFGIKEHATGDREHLYPVLTKSGIEIMSMNLLLKNTTDPVVWRGPIISNTVTQFWSEVVWGDVEYMLVDMPPGTGDVPLTVFQSLPVDGIIVVASPQEQVGMIVEKSIGMAELMHVPVLALVENMSYYRCPDCGKPHEIFGPSRVASVAAKYHIDTFAKLPIDPALAKAVDAGDIESTRVDELQPIVDMLRRRNGAAKA